MSYKSKKKKALPRANWSIVKNTHEPLVDRVIFEKVQNNVKRTNVTNNTKREKRLFENCYPHFMPYDKLEQALLDVIKGTCKKYIAAINVFDIASEINNKKRNDSKLKKKINELQNKEKEYLSKLDMLYEDKFKGIVSDEMYKRIANDTEVLLSKLRTEVNKLKADTKIIKNKTDNLKEYEDKIKSLIDIEKPTRELMQTIIDKIVIDKDKNIEIIYKFSILNSI